MRESVGAVIVAAGSGERMGGVDKLFTEVAGRPLLSYAIAAFQECGAVTRIAVVLSREKIEKGRRLVKELRFDKVASVCEGGPRRQDSVRLGLEALDECDYVVVHDGARPLVSAELIERGIETARESGAAAPAIPLVDTIKEEGEDGFVVKTVERGRLRAVQTPQVFRYELLARAHKEIVEHVTDDAAMVEAIGGRVRLFEGDRRNAKVTEAADLDVVRAILEAGRGVSTLDSGS